MKLALRLFDRGLGLALFAWFVQRAGVERNRARLLESRLARAGGACCRSVSFICSIRWVGALLSAQEGVPGVGFGTLVRIRWAGESINTVLPSAYIGGEAAKVQLLHKLGVPRVQSASSVVAGKTAQVFAQVAFIATGAIAGATILPEKSPARLGMLAITVAGDLHRDLALLASATRHVPHCWSRYYRCVL